MVARCLVVRTGSFLNMVDSSSRIGLLPVYVMGRALSNGNATTLGAWVTIEMLGRTRTWVRIGDRQKKLSVSVFVQSWTRLSKVVQRMAQLLLRIQINGPIPWSPMARGSPATAKMIFSRQRTFAINID
jgi:hypothetical protein